LILSDKGDIKELESKVSVSLDKRDDYVCNLLLAKESKELLLSLNLQNSLLGYSFYSIDDSNEIVFQIFFQFSEKLYVINCN